MFFNYFVVFCILISLSCSKSSNPKTIDTPPSSITIPSYELAWQDNFDAAKLDLTNWYHRYPGVRHDGFNDTTTVSTDGLGNLIIKVYSDTIAGNIKHHTGMVATTKEYKFGKWEVRAAFINKSGSWSAYWLQSATMGSPIGNPQLAGMEIDVVETLHNDGRVHQNILWDGYDVNHKKAGFITGDLGANSGAYHIYTLEWTPTFYKFYVDGVLTWTYSANISQRSEFMILSSEVKNYAIGSWAGPINAGGFGTFKNSQTIMKVDYVKYYKLL